MRNENQKLLKANCHCHIIHNTAKYCFAKFPLDIENLIIKVYKHFSNSAKRLNELKSCFEFVDSEYSTLLRHSSIRWLTLYPAIDRLIQNLNAIKIYFNNQNESELSAIICNNFLSDETNSNQNQLFEIYLYFAHSFIKLFHEKILQFENKKVNSTNLYDNLLILKNQFFGQIVKEKLKLIDNESQKLFNQNAISVYKRALEYLNKHFDFEKSYFKKIKCLNLDSKLNIDDVCEITELFNLNLDMDNLFDEICNFNKVFDILSLEQKNWNFILEKHKFFNLSQIITCVMSIPIGNDFVERVFSVMNNLWIPERN